MHPRSRSSSLPAALLRAAVEYNPLFLLSALALLGGVWLVNPPGAAGGRPASEALPLLAAVRGYEVALLVAMLLLRRAGLARDVRGLGLVLTPFLLDVSRTHALAALLPETWGGTFAACAATLALTLGLALLAGRLAERRFAPGTWVGLLTPVVLALALPLLGSFLTYRGVEAGQVTLVLGLGLALAIGAVGLVAPRGSDVRLVGGIGLGVLASHVLGTTWSHSGDLLLVAGPGLIALGPALPRLLWPGRDDAWTPLLLPAVGALCCAGPEGPVLAWPLAVGALAALAGLEAARRRGLPQLLTALLALDLLLSGAHPGIGWGSLGSSLGEPLLLLGLFGWGLARCAHPLALGGTLGAASLLIWQLDLPLPELVQGLLALDTVGVGFLVWSHRPGARAPADMRLVGVLILVAPAHLLLAPGVREPLAVGLAAGTILGLGLSGLLLRVRLYQLALLLLPLEGARRVAPRGAGAWGLLGIAGGFLLVALGVTVSLYRQRLLAWLDEVRDEPPPGDAESPTTLDPATADPAPAETPELVEAA